MTISLSQTVGKTVWLLIAVILFSLLQGAALSLSTQAEEGDIKSNSAPPQGSETSTAAPVAKSSTAPHFRFINLSTEDGLSHYDVRAIAQDAQGFMWFGTSLGGLNRYDGYEFKVYLHDKQNPLSLSDNTVWSLFVDRSGTLWIGTGRGLDSYNPETDNFTHFQHNPNAPDSLANDDVMSFCQDQSGVMWVGTRQGLSRFNPQLGTFTNYKRDPKNPKGLVHDSLSRITEDPATGYLWLCSGYGVQVFDPQTGNVVAHYRRGSGPKDLNINKVFNVVKDRDGTFWVATGRGLNHLVPEKQKFVRYMNDPKNPSTLSDDQVQDICLDSKGRFWVTTANGLDLFDRELGSFTHYRKIAGDAHSLCANHCSRIFEDKDGGIWIGTFDGGVSRITDYAKEFVPYQLIVDDTLKPDMVKAVCLDRAGRLWIGSWDGLNCYDGQCWTQFRHDPNQSNSLSDNSIKALAEDTRGNLWIGTQQQGLCVWDGAGFKFHLPSTFPSKARSPDFPAQKEITSLLSDDKGGLWIGMPGWLDYFDGTTFTHYETLTKYPELPNAKSTQITLDSAGIIWMGSEQHGLIRFDPATGVFSCFLIDLEHLGTLKANKVYTVLADAEGTIWCGTMSGLHRFDPVALRFTDLYTTADGLPSDSVELLKDDSRGNLWIGTNAGLSKFNRQRKTFRNYDKFDGLPNSLTAGQVITAPDGRMYCGTASGVFAFYPDQLKDNPRPPPVVLTDFELFNIPVSIGSNGSPLTKPINVTDQIRLTSKQTVFSIKFAALDYTAPEKNRYAYKMEGFDDEWRYTDANRRFATYTRLSPGSYTFRVKATNNDGVWNEKGTSLKIIVNPAWWQTWWFRGTVIGVLLALAYAGYRLRIKSINNHSLKLEEQVAERTVQLQAANRELESFAYIASHDLQEPLRMISNYLTLLEKRYKDHLDSDANEFIYYAVDGAKRMQNLIAALLAYSRIGTKSMTFEHTSCEAVLQSVRDNLKIALEESGAQITHTPLPTVTGDSTQLMQLFQNLIGNAIKFRRDRNPEIRIAAEQKNNHWLFSVHDNGIGIDPRNFQRIFLVFQRLHGRDTYPGTGIGLAVCQKIVERHGGEIWVESEPGIGTTFYFTIPKKG